MDSPKILVEAVDSETSQTTDPISTETNSNVVAITVPVEEAKKEKTEAPAEKSEKKEGNPDDKPEEKIIVPPPRGADFVHLHAHSDYSMLDGACKVSRLVKKVKELGQKAIAVTDHGNMFATLEFYLAAKKEGVKALIGSEFYVTPKTIEDREDKSRHHLVLIAKNYEGYQNLCRLSEIAWSEDGYWYRPRIDKNALKKHHEGLLCLSACIGGEIPALLLEDQEEEAREAIEFYISLFGREDFYLEVQYHAQPGVKASDIVDEEDFGGDDEEAIEAIRERNRRNAEQRDLLTKEEKANLRLRDLAAEYGLGLVATNDAHYLNEEDWEAHDALLCIGTGSQITDEKRLRFSGDQFYVKSSMEMIDLFEKDYPGSIANTVKIADKCDLILPEGDNMVNHYPVFRLEDKSDDPNDAHCPLRRKFLLDICLKALATRYNVKEGDNPDYVPGEGEPSPEERKEILDRMNYELDIIDRMGYISYFLVVWDFINYARSIDIPVGPGRGSGAGSIVAYLTGITNLDPLRYQLLFERFLNPDRVSPPDFDIDFCERRRGEVIDYVRNKYGAKSVAQIGTFGTLKAKQVLKDVARVMGIDFSEANKMVALVPTGPKVTLKSALEDSLELKKVYDSQEEFPWIQKVFDMAKVLEGLNRNQSIHACGVIIGDQELGNIVPLARGAGKELITQFPAVPCEELGLLKMDFLGLKTLTIIEDTLKMVNSKREGDTLGADDIPLGDQKTFDLMNQGKTVAVFQLESGGMQDLCRKFGIEKLEEIIALVALYRPGPMEFIPTFINCKFGREKPDYDTPEMEELLNETYGIMVYQEQIMQVCQAVAGFSLAQADIMRRAIGKKKEKLMLEYGEIFKKGVVSHGGYSPEIAQNIWDKILKFASYGFNKSHSACYGLLSYRTGYLKANYPAEFMAAVLNGEINNAEKMAFYITETRKMQLTIAPPDVNSSDLRFSVADGVIRFGLGAIKGAGSVAVEKIIQSRKQDGRFKNLTDFCERCGDTVGKRVMENLCKAGAFDTFGLKRAQISEMIPNAYAAAQQTIKDRKNGQPSLFDVFDDPADRAGFDIVVPDVDEWPENECLNYEKELLGFYVTGHPIAKFMKTILKFQTDDIVELQDLPDETGVRVGGLISRIDMKISKKTQKTWCIFTLEGIDAEIECLTFASNYEKCKEAIVAKEIVFVEGTLSAKDEGSHEIRVENVIPMREAPLKYVSEIHIRIPEKEANPEKLQQLFTIYQTHPGKVSTLLCIMLEDGTVNFIQPERKRVDNSLEFREKLLQLFGDKCLFDKSNSTRPSFKSFKKWKKDGKDDNGENDSKAES